MYVFRVRLLKLCFFLPEAMSLLAAARRVRTPQRIAVRCLGVPWQLIKSSQKTLRSFSPFKRPLKDL